MSPPQTRDRRHRRGPDTFDARAGRRAVSMLVLSAIMPGSAQLLRGNRAVGRIVLRAWLIMLGIGLSLGLLAWVSVSTAVSLVSAQWFLRLAHWALLIWALVWAAVIIDAWRLSHPPSQPAPIRRYLALATAVLMLLPAGAAYASASVSAGRQALADVFADGAATGLSNGRYNILLLGGDGGGERVGTRPDTIQVVSVDGTTGRAAMFAFARDTEQIVFEPGSVMAGLMPGGWVCGNDCLLNGLYTWARDHEELFPPDVEDPGVLATREAVEALSGLDINYYVLVDLAGFESVIDAVGGLEINVARRTPIGGIGTRISDWIEPGVQHLDGRTALWYARSRVGSTNYERMARQRCVVTAMAQQIDPVAVATNFAGLARSTSGVLQTDIPQSDLGNLAELALRTRSQKISSVSFVPPLIKPWNYDPEFVRATVADTIAASEQLDQAEAARPVTSPDVALRVPGVARGSGAASIPSAPVTDTADRPTEANPGAGLERPGEDADAVAGDAVEVCSAA